MALNHALSKAKAVFPFVARIALYRRRDTGFYGTEVLEN